MSNFVKIGKHRINLDHVSDVYELGDGSVRVYYDYAISGDYNAAIPCHDTFKGDEAKLLIALLDSDDEQVDALFQRVNGKPEPETILTTKQVEALGGAIEAADEVDTMRAYPINFINLNSQS
jgi:hypothetical protein